MKRQFYFIPQLVAIVFAYLAFLAFDRTPPLILYEGKITPGIVSQGQENVEVKWKATFSGRDCGGYSQREILSLQGRYLHAELKRARGGVFEPDYPGSLEGTVVTPPLTIPDMKPGPASYRVTQFYYCNWLQKVIGWPIVQVSPFILFEVR